MTKCVCGNEMVDHRLRPDRYVCHKCGRTKVKDDSRKKLQDMINEMDEEEVNTLLRILEDKYS